MAKDPAALLFIDNWLVSTKEMKADERGWYLNLVLHQYDKGDLPNDIEELANLADVRFSEYDIFRQKWEQVLKHKFELNGKGRLENPKAKEVIRKREDFKDKRSLSGKIGYVVKVAIKELNATEEQVAFIKENIDFNEIDIKDKQVLKQMLKQTIKLYINGDGDKPFIDKEPISWRTNFDVYKKEAEDGYMSLIGDAAFILEKEELNPNVDILLTLKKAFVEYWGTEKAWKAKKASKTKDIDWKATYTNAININKVYKPFKKRNEPNAQTIFFNGDNNKPSTDFEEI